VSIQKISIAQYAIKHKLSQFQVIKKVNAKELESVEEEGKVWIIIRGEISSKTTPSPLRRNEFSSDDEGIFETLMQTCDYGTLSLAEEGVPYGVPVNFAWWNESVVFHGAKEGRKTEVVKKNPNATFSVVKPYAFIPSHATHATLACPATQFFASIMLQGTVLMVEDASQKAAALSALMAKHQPEGKHELLSSLGHKAMLEKTAVFALSPSSRTMKLKFGQNLPSLQQEKIIKALRARDGILDEETIAMIENLSKCKGEK